MGLFDELKKLFVGDTSNQPSSQRQSGSSSSRFQSQTGPCNVILINDGGNKVATIKTIRVIRSELGLKEAKALVDGAPNAVKEGIGKEEADQIKAELEEVGAVVEIK